VNSPRAFLQASKKETWETDIATSIFTWRETPRNSSSYIRISEKCFRFEI
jgi:hypothetical protein